MTVRRLRTLPSLKASKVRRASPGLSSTSRISIARELIRNLSCSRNCEEECRSASELRLNPDSAAVPVHDSAADGKPYSGACVLLARMQALEHLKYALEVLRLDADPVVLNREYPGLVDSLGVNMYVGHARVAILEGVTE